MTPERVETRHLEAIAALEASVFHAPWSAESLALLTGDTGVGFVITEGDFALCYGGMMTVLDEGQITNIATHESARRQGHASRVVEALLTEARARGLVEVTLEVRESNTAAIALYERHGFVTVGKRPRFYTKPVEAALVMSCALGGERRE